MPLLAFYTQEGAWSLYNFSIIIISGRDRYFYLQGFDINWTAKGFVPPELSSSQIAIYFAETIQPFIIRSYCQLHRQLASQLYYTTKITSLAIRDQPIMLLFLPIMLCCSALKIHLLCSRTRIVVRLLCFYMQFCMAIHYMQQTIFIQTVLLVCINESTSILLSYDDRSIRVYQLFTTIFYKCL